MRAVAIIMKLLMITGSFPPMPCGVGDYSAKLAGALAARGDLSVIVLTDQRAALNTPPAGVTVLPCVKDWTWRGVAHLLRLVHEQNPDIVHIQYPTAGYGTAWGIQFVPFLLRIVGVRVVETWHEPTRFRCLPNSLSGRQPIIVVEPDYVMRVRFYYRPLITQRIRYIPLAPSIPSATISVAESSELRASYASPDERILVYFGFAIPNKGIEQIFEVADLKRDIIILICSLDSDNAYHRKLLAYIASSSWSTRTVITGFLEPENVANLLRIADAAVFPFVEGVGMRNTSVLAAKLQGTFTLTTALHRQGYDDGENVFYVLPGDCAAMRAALNQYAGCRSTSSVDSVQSWITIAMKHVAVYEELKFNNFTCKDTSHVVDGG